MKKLKNYLCAVLVLLISSASCMEANALFGNTHFNLGKKIIENSKMSSLSEDEKNAFLSGLVYADIGRFRFDKETGIESDSEIFVEEMKKHAETPEEKCFVRGFEMHVFQDKKTGNFLKRVFGNECSSYFEYIMRCGLLDCYFFKKNDSFIYDELVDKFNFDQVSSGMNIKTLSKLAGIPINDANDAKKKIDIILKCYCDYINKDSLVIYGDLIRKTYQSLGFGVSIDDIYEQAANIVGSFVVSTAVAGQAKVPEGFDSTIESQSDEIVNLCISNFNLCE